MRVLFEATGHRVTIAASVAAAVAAITNEHTDVVLLDLKLPDGDGLEVLANLRAAGAAPPKTIAITGHDDPEIAERCRAMGCAEVLMKPVPVGTLLAKVRELTQT